MHHCKVRPRIVDQTGNCIVAKDGLVLKYDVGTGAIIYQAKYGHKAGNGYRPDFADDKGAEQSSNEVWVWAGDKSTTYPAFR